MPGGCVSLALAARLCLPGCGRQKHCVIKTRNLYQCTSCRRQTSLIAGTIFASTKVPLRTWFRAMYHLTQSKGGISSLALGRRLGVTQNTAWKLKHKLMQVMRERDAGKRLTGRVEIDDAYLGGERSGGKRGRGAPGKTPIIVAMETTPEGQPVRLKLRRSTASGARRWKSWPGAASIPPAPSSAMASLASAVSPMRDARISRSAPAPAARRCGHPPSSRSTPRSATSRNRPSPPPTGPSARNTSLATWPNSPTASIGATISPP